MCCYIRDRTISGAQEVRQGISPTLLIPIACVVAFTAIALLAKFGILNSIGTTPALYLQYSAYAAAALAFVVAIAMIAIHCCSRNKQQRQKVMLPSPPMEKNKNKPAQTSKGNSNRQAQVITKSGAPKETKIKEPQNSKGLPKVYTRSYGLVGQPEQVPDRLTQWKQELNRDFADYLKWEEGDYAIRGLDYKPVREKNIICPYKPSWIPMEALVYLTKNERELLLSELTEDEVEHGSCNFLDLLDKLPPVNKPHDWRDFFGIFIYERQDFSTMDIYSHVHDKLAEMRRKNPLYSIRLAMSHHNWESERMLQMRLIYVTLVKLRIPRMKNAEWRWWLRIKR